jgi:hypothetical protein
VRGRGTIRVRVRVRVRVRGYGCVKKILQMRSNKANKQIHFSTQSYEEMI